MYSVARIGQVQIMYRARLVSADVAAGVESEEVALVDWADIPWEQLAFPTVVWALAHFHDSRGKTDFATYSNPTGDLARMWPPRKPAGSVQVAVSPRPEGSSPRSIAGFAGFCYQSYERPVSGRIRRKPCSLQPPTRC